LTTPADEYVVWRVRKAVDGLPVVAVTIQRTREWERGDRSEAFDERTLGQWKLIPDAYRAYWSFDCTLAKMSVPSESHTSARGLYDKLNLYLDENKLPAGSPRLSCVRM